MPLPPKRLIGGRYLLADELGHGGMGTVWRAHDQVLDRPVALKEVAVPQWIAGAERERAFERVLREARATARLRHPSVITIHDVVMDAGRPWIVMELLPVQSLAVLLERAGALPEAEVAEIGIKLLDALRTAHEAGITHRDVKPGNVLLVEDGGVVLSDFGIAHVDNSATLTSTGMLMGSPAYMAPERIEGQRASAGSDLWALGATLYSAVEGASPYQGPTPVALLAAILMGEARPMRRADRLRPVIEGLMRKDPGERLSAAEAMAELVRAGAGHGPPRAGSPALAALVRHADPTPDDAPTDPTLGAIPPPRDATHDGTGARGAPGVRDQAVEGWRVQDHRADERWSGGVQGPWADEGRLGASGLSAVLAWVGAVASVLGVAAYALPGVVRRVGLQVQVVDRSTALLFVLGGMTLVAVVVPGVLLARTRFMAVVLTAVPVAATAVMLTGYRWGYVLEGSLEIAFGLLAGWAVAIAARTWARSKVAALAAGGAGAGFLFSALLWAATHLGIGTGRLMDFAEETATAMWGLTAVWQIWAARRTSKN